MSFIEKYPSLNYFFTCYFHQDFKVLFSSAEETISAYRTTETAEELAKMKDEVERLLELALPDEELQDLLMNKMDCYYCYLNDWDSSELWLRYIHKQLTIRG